jgi:uncharacterized caspase-like protein
MKKLLLLSIVVWYGVVLTHSKTYMVAVGLADYPGKKMDLSISSNDAVVIKELYEKNCEASVTLLTDKDATLSEILRQMELVYGKAKKKDVIILFFSGHGLPGGFMCYDQILKYEDINRIMSTSRAKNKIVFSDACYSGKARKTNKLSDKHYNYNIMFFLSSRTDEQSLERRGWKNSYFTAYLERGLRGGADFNKDRTITAFELFTFVSQGVKEVSHDMQHPVMWGNFDNEMPIMVWK